MEKQKTSNSQNYLEKEEWNWLVGKDPDSGRDWGQEEKGTTEDEMAGRPSHIRLNGYEFG